MMKLFKRNLQVIITGDEKPIILKEPLEIKCEVVKNIKTGEKDYANIIVYNLKKSTRDAINNQYEQIKIVGGYGTQSDIIFLGKIVSATHKQEKTEWITEINCGDGADVLSQAIVNKTYEKDFKLKDIITDFANVSGITIDEIIGIDDSFALTRGKSFTGSMKDSLEQLGNSAGFDWSLQDEKLVVVQRGSSRSEVITTISANSGMVGSPEWINKGTDSQKLKDKSGLEFKVVSLLIPSLKPADKIVIQSQSLKGKIDNYEFNIEKENYTTLFKVNKVHHTLNSRRANFISTIECEILGGNDDS